MASDRHGKGEIELPAIPAKSPKASVRHVGASGSEHPYTIDSVMQFLGWNEYKVQAALTIIDAANAGAIEQAAAIVGDARW
jgi:hypothetical protein